MELTKFEVGDTEYSFETQNSHSVTMPSGALLTVNKDGSVAYDPNSQFEELEPGETAQNPDTFTYTVADDENATASTTATISIDGLADNPVAEDDIFSTDEDTAKDIHVLRNDSDPNTLKEELKVTKINGISVELNGSITLNSGAIITVKEVDSAYKSNDGDYTIQYDPTQSVQINRLNTGDPDYVETFTYTVSDPEGNTGEGSATVNVEGITDYFAD